MDITMSLKAPISWKYYLKINAGLWMWAFSCKYDLSPVTITVNDICMGIVLFMSWCNYPPSLSLSLSLTRSPFALSGIPGKKCGVIIFTAEELSNCRVSVAGIFSYCLHLLFALMLLLWSLAILSPTYTITPTHRHTRTHTTCNNRTKRDHKM